MIPPCFVRSNLTVHSLCLTFTFLQIAKLIYNTLIVRYICVVTLTGYNFFKYQLSWIIIEVWVLVLVFINCEINVIFPLFQENYLFLFRAAESLTKEWIERDRQSSPGSVRLYLGSVKKNGALPRSVTINSKIETDVWCTLRY